MVIILVCILPLMGPFSKRIAFIEFPVFFSLTALGWFLPQLWAAANYGTFPEGAVAKAALMAFLCFLGVNAGYVFYRPNLQSSKLSGDVERLKTRLVIATLVLLPPYLLTMRLPVEDLEGGWSGLPVIYLFFYSGIKYAFYFAFLLWLGGDRSRKTLFVMVIGTFLYVNAAITGGRRADMLELFFLIVGGLFFVKRLRFSKWIFVAAMIGFSFFTTNIVQYRSIMSSDSTDKFGQVLAVDWIGNFQNYFKDPNGEVGNYIMGIYAIDQEGSFNYGLNYWNSLVSRFIPRQLVGESVKNKLLAPVVDSAITSGQFGHEAMTGQTFTGMMDAFGAFSYFGCLNFILIGIAFKYLYLKAQQGSLKGIMFYLFMLTSGLHSITHTSDWCLFAFIHLYIFTWPYQKFAMIAWPPKTSSLTL